MKKLERKKNKALPIMIGVGLILFWEIFARIINASYILPSPSEIFLEIIELKDSLFTIHLPYTMLITFISLGISIFIGVSLAVLMDAFPTFEDAVYPIIVTSQTIPTTALAPLFILWFGYSIWSKVLVAVLITFFPITISVHDGLKEVKREHIELLQSYGASKFQVFVKLKIMTALSNFFTALKMAIPISIIGAAIGEWLGSEKGLGYFSKRMVTRLNGPGVFAPIVILSLSAVLLVVIVSLLEKRSLKWRAEI